MIHSKSLYFYQNPAWTDLWHRTFGKSYIFSFGRFCQNHRLHCFRNHCLDLLPALRVCFIKISVSAAGYCRTASAPGQELTFGTFFKFSIVSVILHLTDPNIGKTVLEYISHFTVLHPPAGINISIRKNGQMTVPTVAASIYHAILGVFWNPKSSCLIFVQSPEMVFFIEKGLAA